MSADPSHPRPAPLLRPLGWLAAALARGPGRAVDPGALWENALAAYGEGRPEESLRLVRRLLAQLSADPARRAALLHAICRIEFNAINLALDAVWRFAGMPEAYYRDWLRVAAEEAEHYATNLAATWEVVRDVRVVESSDPVNFAIVDGELKEIKS